MDVYCNAKQSDQHSPETSVKKFFKYVRCDLQREREPDVYNVQCTDLTVARHALVHSRHPAAAVLVFSPLKNATCTTHLGCQYPCDTQTIKTQTIFSSLVQLIRRNNPPPTPKAPPTHPQQTKIPTKTKGPNKPKKCNFLAKFPLASYLWLERWHFT